MTAGAKRRILLTVMAVAAMSMAVFYFAFNPEESRWMPRCVFKAFTGFECPGCGSQRAIHALLHGEIAAAWGYNPFLLCMIPVVALYARLDFSPQKTPRIFRFFYSPLIIGAIGGSIIIWGIVRNI